MIIEFVHNGQPNESLIKDCKNLAEELGASFSTTQVIGEYVDIINPDSNSGDLEDSE